MKKKVLIVEDNEKSRKALLKMLSEIDQELILYEADNIDVAYRYAMQYKIHLFILDIIMDPIVRGDTSGMEFASNVRKMRIYKTTPIIFITALEDPMLFAYSEIHCYQYIEKTFQEEKVAEKVREALGIAEESEDDRTIFFRKEGILFPVKIADIQYIVFKRPTISIYRANDILEVGHQPIERILRMLNSDHFLQYSRNTIVNVDYIEMIDVVSNYIKLKNGSRIILGVSYRRSIMREIGNG